MDRRVPSNSARSGCTAFNVSAVRMRGGIEDGRLALTMECPEKLREGHPSREA